MPSEPPKGREELKMLLEHSRALFIYHAGQRLSTINYFFVAFAIFTTAYVSAFSKELDSLHLTATIQTMLGVVAFFVTWFFSALDKRNETLVHLDEKAQEAIERLVNEQYQIPRIQYENEEIEPFLIVQNWREDTSSEHYHDVVARLYRVFLTVSALSTVLPWGRFLCL
jgi:hypothetical protein